MAIVHVNGFGTVPVVGDAIGYVAPTSGTMTYSRQAGRNAGYSLRATNSISGATTTTSGGYTLAVSTFTEFSLGFAFNHRNTFTNTGQVGISLAVAGGQWWAVFGTGTANSYPYVAPSTTAFTVVDASVTAVGWHWWNFIYRQSATVGLCEVWRDGTRLAHANGDTLPSGAPALTGLSIFNGNSNGGAQVDIADLIIRNDATAIPDSRVDTLFPTGTTAGGWLGSDGNSTDNHLLVNENPDHNAATYVGASAINTLDTYTMADLPSTASAVHAVQVGARAFKSGAGAKTIAPMINGVAGTALDPGGGATVYQLATTNPSGGAAWDTASVNAMTAGIKVVS